MKLPFPAKLVSTIGTAKRLSQTLAQPRLAQLVLQIALAVVFRKSGILKRRGFLLLNDTVIYLFTQEFQLHLPD
jgi:putative oxidoreductase